MTPKGEFDKSIMIEWGYIKNDWTKVNFPLNAKDIETKHLKEKYGHKLTFWGGSVDTQQVLAFGSPDDVKKQVMEQCKVLSPNGGFIFNTVHNIQANIPVENIVVIIDTLKQINRE